MKKLLLLALFAFGAFQIWEKFNEKAVAPIYQEPYVAVYGRDSCGFTQKMISDLQASGMEYHYFSVDDQSVADGLHSRMEASGISTRRYLLPVVDTNGVLEVRPKFQVVVEKYSGEL